MNAFPCKSAVMRGRAVETAVNSRADKKRERHNDARMSQNREPRFGFAGFVDFEFFGERDRLFSLMLALSLSITRWNDREIIVGFGRRATSASHRP